MRTSIVRLFATAGFCISAVSEYGLSFDFPLTPALWLAITAVALLATTTQATLQTNGWIASGSGKWETSSNWSGGTPALSNAANIVAGGSTLPSTAIIDATTSGNSPGSMTVSNLIVRRYGGIGAMKPAGTVSMDNAGSAIPLVIENSLTISLGGTLSVTNSSLTVGAGNFSDDGNLVFNATNGSEIRTLTPLIVGDTGAGQMTVFAGRVWLPPPDFTNAVSLVIANNPGSSGTLTIGGGTVSADALFVATTSNTTGAVWLNGGTLTATNGYVLAPCCAPPPANPCDEVCISTNFVLSQVGLGVGQLTVSNGTMILTGLDFLSGTLTFAGGTATLHGNLNVSFLGGTGAVWITGGQLSVTNANAEVTVFPPGQITVSNGIFNARDYSISGGTLTMAGGTTTISSSFFLIESSGAVWLTGGQLITTNADVTLTVGEYGAGYLTESSGVWRAADVAVGSPDESGQGTLTIAGGDAHVYSNMTLGPLACAATGIVNVTGGNLYVTNASHNAILEVRSGTFTQSGGVVKIDVLVVNNACGHFIHTGGMLIYSQLVLDPNLSAVGDGIPNGWKQQYGFDPFNPAVANTDSDGDGMNNLQEYLAGTDPTNSASAFHITTIAPTGNNVVVRWITGLGKTNALQSTSGAGYNTNFTDLVIITNTTTTITNATDVGGATNQPARFYRVRLVP